MNKKILKEEGIVLLAFVVSGLILVLICNFQLRRITDSIWDRVIDQSQPAPQAQPHNIFDQVAPSSGSLDSNAVQPAEKNPFPDKTVLDNFDDEVATKRQFYETLRHIGFILIFLGYPAYLLIRFIVWVFKSVLVAPAKVKKTTVLCFIGILILVLLWFFNGGMNIAQTFFVYKIEGIGNCLNNGDICLSDGEWQKGQPERYIDRNGTRTEATCRYHFTLINKSNKTYKVKGNSLAFRNKEGFLIRECSFPDRILHPGESWNVEGTENFSAIEESEVATVGDIKVTLLSGDQIREDAERSNAFWASMADSMNH